jgi:cytidine deaminase
MSAELTTERARELLAAAQTASENAYAPFSHFRVGAAVLTAAGEIFAGCNVENSSYGLSVCAERTAIFTAVAAGALGSGKQIAAIAIVNRDGAPCSPCGACRQVIYEFGPRALVLYRTLEGELTQTTALTLLPEAFRLG